MFHIQYHLKSFPDDIRIVEKNNQGSQIFSRYSLCSIKAGIIIDQRQRLEQDNNNSLYCYDGNTEDDTKT